MFSRISSEFRSYFRLQAQHLRYSFQKNPWSLAKSMRMPLLAACYTLIPAPIHLQDEEKTMAKDLSKTAKEDARIVQKPPSLVARLWSVLVHLVRFCQLMIIFAPTILLSPLLLFKSTEGFWMDLFVKAIERSGVVFIKAFQYLSHRRDIIGPELAAKFEYLREKAPTHSLETTKQYFRDSYGKKIEEIFD